MTPSNARTRGGSLDLVGLLEQILAGLPSLPDRACSSSPHLFDPGADGEPAADVAERHAIALEICRDCPVLVDCSRWVDDLPEADLPAGVVAAIAPRRPGRPSGAVA